MRAAVWNFTTKSTRGHWEDEKVKCTSRGVAEQRRWGRRAKRREREREKRVNERDRDEDGERRRGRETRETKGMWSSPSLCLAALWLKRRIPGERGGSRPAQSVRSLPWSPACRPQKHTAKTFRKGSFYCTGSPHRLQRICKASTDCHGTRAPLNFRRRGSASDEPPPQPGSFYFFDVLMKILRVS